MKIKKLLRTLQVNLSLSQDTLYNLKRLLRKLNKTPFEVDFRALRLFPDSEEQIFLDVGSNRGQSIDAIRLYRKNSKIIAFEPNKFLCEKLFELYKYDKKILIQSFGLGDIDGEFTLYVPFYKRWMFDGLASLHRDNAQDFLRSLDHIYFYNHRFLSLREIKVRVRRLDELELCPFFMKLDVQGHELEVLRGGEKTLKSYEPVLLIECPEDGVIKYLQRLKYQYFRFDRNYFVRDLKGSPNTFFMTKNKSDLVRKYI
jgi:FkbM family methyltransferase